MEHQESYFDGRLIQQIGWRLLAMLITDITIGICYPWALCMVKKWEIKHTVVEGKRLVFDGTGGQLLGKWIVWFLLSIITIGIYGLWVNIKMKKWVTMHIHYADEVEAPKAEEPADEVAGEEK